MLDATRDVLKAALRADPSVDPGERTRLLALLRTPEAATKAAEGPRIIRRIEAAARLSVSPRTIDNLASEGILPRVTFPGRERAVGFREADVMALIEARG